MENRAEDILATVVDGAVVERLAGHDNGYDLCLRTRDGQIVALQLKWAGKGWPQDIRRVTETVPKPWPADVVLVARRLSPGAIERLRELNANWADETGQARIYGPNGLIVIREHLEAHQPSQASRGFSWSASAIDLAELVLSGSDDRLRATELARETRWSAAQVANVLKAFDARGWTVKRGAARGPYAYRELVEADGMLDAWSTALAESPRTARIAHRATTDVMRLLHDELAPAFERKTEWAVSGWAGLELVAPFATTIPNLHIYVAQRDFHGTLSNVIADASLHEVDEGGRVTFWPASADVLARATSREGVSVVSAPRLYADLLSFGARGFDAAAHVKEQAIDPLHHEPAPERIGNG